MPVFVSIYLFIMLMFIIFAVAIYYTNKRMEEERTKGMEAMAAELGMNFYPAGDDAFTEAIRDTYLMTLGHTRSITNLMMGKYGGRETAVFDCRYVIGHGKNRQEWKVTVVCLWFNGSPLPRFTVRPEHFGHKLGEIFGFQDFDFDSRPEFSARYVLQGEEETRVRAEFHPNVFTFFEGRPGLFSEGKGDRFLLYRPGVRPDPRALRGLIDEALDALQRFRPSYAQDVVSAAAYTDVPNSELETQNLHGGAR